MHSDICHVVYKCFEIFDINDMMSKHYGSLLLTFESICEILNCYCLFNIN